MNLPERNSDNKLPAYAWPGGYPIIYIDGENSILCADCATKCADSDEWRDSLKPVDCDVFYEGAPEHCEQCNKEIESAYGDPESEDSSK
jgi:hypothetical protein